MPRGKDDASSSSRAVARPQSCGAIERRTCNTEQRAPAHLLRLTSMTPSNKKQTLAVGWTLAVLITGLVASVGSPTSWLIVGVVALGPSLVLLHLSRELSQTTSQRIQEARR